MRVEHISNAVDTTGVQSLQFGIEGSALIYKLMYSTMFQDKEKVVLQELAANALDAHRAANKIDVPISIVLPTEISPELVIQDEGIGMSYDTVCNVYPVYGRSLKSNNNTDIGGFGYGGKSPFAISESYTVETTHQGITTTIACYLDNGYPKFSVFTTGAIGKPDGTTVRIPVTDLQKQLILKRKAETLFVLWDVKPKFSGFPIDYSKNTKIYENANLILFNGTADGSWKPKIRQVAVGPYIYNIPDSVIEKISSNFDYQFLSQISKNPVSYMIVLKFSIGEIELSPSREWIEDTSTNITAILNKINEEASTIRTTKVPVSLQWYEQISEVVQVNGLWSKQFLSDCKINVPVYVDPEHVKDKLKELRGTSTNPLTNNYDSKTVWRSVIDLIIRDPELIKKYFIKNSLAPVHPTELLQSYNQYEFPNGTLSKSPTNNDNAERVNYLGYIDLPLESVSASQRETASHKILRRLIHISKNSTFLKIKTDDGRVCKGSLSLTCGVSSYDFNRLAEIILYPEDGKEVKSYLKYAVKGNYLIVTTSPENIKSILNFVKTTNDKATPDEAIHIKVVAPDEVDKAYLQYKEDVKLARKNMQITGKSRASDPEIGRLYNSITESSYVPLTKNTLLQHKFDEKDTNYIIAKSVDRCSRNSYDEFTFLNSELLDKYDTHLTKIKVIVITDSSKMKTDWWGKFVNTLNQYPQVALFEQIGTCSSELQKYIQTLPNIAYIDKIIDKWKTYASIFPTQYPITVCSALLELQSINDFILPKCLMNMYKRIYATEESTALQTAIFNDPLAKSAFAKIAVADNLHDFSFINLISKQEKEVFLKIVNTHLQIYTEVNNDSEHPNT